MELPEQVFNDRISMSCHEYILIAQRFKGRTTFINTLCGRRILDHKESDDPMNAHIEEGVKIKPIHVGKFGQSDRK